MTLTYLLEVLILIGYSVFDEKLASIGMRRGSCD
jgi:hypothetical protein